MEKSKLIVNSTGVYLSRSDAVQDSNVIDAPGSSGTCTDDKCSICLGHPIIDVTDLDGCFHRFCFLCISEWIKLKSICPMCKRPVTKLKHKVILETGVEIDKDVATEEIQRNAVRERILADSTRPMSIERIELIRRIRNLQRLVRVHDEISTEGRHIDGEIDDLRRRDYVDRINRYQLLLDNWERPRGEVVGDPTFRVFVYDMRLRRSPLVRAAQLSNRRSGISPHFFRDNESTERPRIAEFVRREITSLLPNAVDVEAVISRIYELAMFYQIMSPMFTSTLTRDCSALTNYVDHFVELLFEFVVSGQDVVLFDQNSQYIRTEYRRRLTSLNLELFGGNVANNNDAIQIDEVVDLRDILSQGGVPAEDESALPASRLHFISAYSDALISLRRFLLILESSDETLPVDEELVLEEVVEAILHSYDAYRERVRRRQNMRGGRDIVLIDTDSENDERNGPSRTATTGIRSENRRRFEELRERRRSQRLMRIRHRNRPTFRSASERARPSTLGGGFHRNTPLTRITEMLVEQMNQRRNLHSSLQAHTNNSNEVIDLIGSPSFDDDVQVLNDTSGRHNHRHDDEIVIGDNGNASDIIIDDELTGRVVELEDEDSQENRNENIEHFGDSSWQDASAASEIMMNNYDNASEWEAPSGSDSESGDEGIYVHDACRLPRISVVPQSAPIAASVTVGEIFSINSNVTLDSTAITSMFVLGMHYSGSGC